MITIHKYPFPIVGNIDQSDLVLPQDAKFLMFNYQRRVPCVWFLVDTSKPTEHRHLVLCGTGTQVPENATHLASAQTHDEMFVFHLFELVKEEG